MKAIQQCRRKHPPLPPPRRGVLGATGPSYVDAKMLSVKKYRTNYIKYRFCAVKLSIINEVHFFLVTFLNRPILILPKSHDDEEKSRQSF